MACFGIAHSASSGDKSRFNKNMLNLLKENEIPIVNMNTIDIFLPSNPPAAVFCFASLKVQPILQISPLPQTSPLQHVVSQNVRAFPNPSPTDIPNNSIDILETSSVEFSTPTAEPIKRSNKTPKRKKAAANPEMKIYFEATANPRPVNESSARRNLLVKKSICTVFKVNSVPIRNNDELLIAVENRQAFIKNKKGLICSYENYKAQLLKMKPLQEIISINFSQFNNYLSVFH